MKRSILATGMAAILAVLAAPALAVASEVMAVHELKQHTHIHGLAVDRTDTDHLLIATHHGVFRAGPDGMAQRISPVKDFMGFTPHPVDPDTFYGSGHPARGGNLGFIVSTDGGATWQQRSPGVNGPVDFHQMTASSVDPDLIYGAYGALQRSLDGGHSWSVVGPLPTDLISLAASGREVDTLYAGTRSGLMVSRDGGRSWDELLSDIPVSLVAVDGEGGLFAFVPGHGLVRAEEGTTDFSTLAQAWEDHVVLHMAFDPDDPRRVFAASHQSVVFLSEDGGRTWSEVRASTD